MLGQEVHNASYKGRRGGVGAEYASLLFLLDVPLGHARVSGHFIYFLKGFFLKKLEAGLHVKRAAHVFFMSLHPVSKNTTSVWGR